MAKLAKTTKITKKVITPVVEEEVASVEEVEIKKVEVKSVEPVLYSKKDLFMEQVDRALENSYKLYERKSLTRQEIEGIVNSILR